MNEAPRSINNLKKYLQMETLFSPSVNDQMPSPGMEKLFQSLRRLENFTTRCVLKVKDQIDKHPLPEKSTDYFADWAGIDRKVLQQIFKEKYQVTISTYQMQKRMEVAATLLQEGNLSYKQIAGKCGYHNVNNFSRAFKKVFKLSPKQFLHYLDQQPLDSADIKKD